LLIKTLETYNDVYCLKMYCPSTYNDKNK